MKKKFLTSVIATLLSSVLAVTGIIVKKNYEKTEVAALTRTVELSITPEYETYLKDFSNKTIEGNEEKVSFHGTMNYNEQVLSMFDQVALAENIDKEQSNIVYDCDFNAETMQFTFKATLLDENGNVLEIDEMITDAFVTEMGQLDAYIEIDGKIFKLSDYFATTAIEECLWKWIAAAVAVTVVVIYVVVAETAEQIRAKSNYKYNKQLEASNRGVGAKVYITGQNRTSISSNSPGNYRFGFTTFGKVGCEVAAAYNAMIALNKSERLSDTIYSFEKWAIEFSIAWGNFGSNPLQISTYLRKKGINYKKITNYNSFKSAVNTKSECNIIMSSWNSPWTAGLHTYYIAKKSGEKMFAYNWKYHDRDPFTDYSEISKFSDKNKFIVGYIVW